MKKGERRAGRDIPTYKSDISIFPSFFCQKNIYSCEKRCSKGEKNILFFVLIVENVVWVNVMKEHHHGIRYGYIACILHRILHKAYWHRSQKGGLLCWVRRTLSLLVYLSPFHLRMCIFLSWERDMRWE